MESRKVSRDLATKTSRLSSLRSRATSKAAAPAVATAEPAAPTAPITAPAPVAPAGGGGEGQQVAPRKKRPAPAAESAPAPAPTQPALVPSGALSLGKVSVAEAVEAQRKHLEAVGAGEYFIDYTDADGGMSTRLRSTIHVSPEALAAVQELRLEEEARYGKAPRLYHYVELALVKFMPTAEDAAEAVDAVVPVYESISTAISREAKMVMVSTRKVRNNATGKAVVKHWFYSQAMLKMVAARRAALGLF